MRCETGRVLPILGGMNRSLLLVGLLLLAPAASAQNTLVLEEQVGARFEIKVTASDDLNTSTDSVFVTDPFVGSVLATPRDPAVGKTQAQRNGGLDLLADHPHLLSRRVQESRVRGFPMGLVVFHGRPWCAPDRREGLALLRFGARGSCSRAIEHASPRRLKAARFGRGKGLLVLGLVEGAFQLAELGRCFARHAHTHSQEAARRPREFARVV